MRIMNIYISCYFDGKIIINERNKPLHTSSSARALMVRKSSFFNKLETETYTGGGISKGHYGVNIVCNWIIAASQTTSASYKWS